MWGIDYIALTKVLLGGRSIPIKYKDKINQLSRRQDIDFTTNLVAMVNLIK